MRKAVSVLAAFSFLMFLSQATLAHEEHTHVNFTEIADYKVPGFIGKMIGDARVDIYDYDNYVLGSMVVLNGTLNETSESLLENPTHKVFVKDAATLRGIFSADSPLKEFNRQRSLHNIDIQATDFFDQIKLVVSTIVASLLAVFIAPE